MTVPVEVARELDDEALAQLRRVIPSLNLLADFSRSDVFLFARSGPHVAVVEHARPQPVPSLYQHSLAGHRLPRERVPTISRVLYAGKPRHQVYGAVVAGVPVVREIFAIESKDGRVIAALVSETPAIEHGRQRRRNHIFRHSISRVRELVSQGRLVGCEEIGRLTAHDGVMVIDEDGMILYVDAVAEGMYRILGYTDSLTHTQLSELDTNEYIAFRAMELEVCIEQRVIEQDSVWIKKAIPLPRDPKDHWSHRLPVQIRPLAGAILVLQDVTDQARKEQELRVKNAMIQEIHHRVKNNLQAIAALLRLQTRRTNSPEVAAALDQTVSRILSVAVLHEFLLQDEATSINIHEVSNRILREVTQGTLDPDKEITLTLEGVRQFLLPAQQATSCALIINELLQNAVEHGFANTDRGSIVVRLLQTEDTMTVEVEDDGEGLPPGFDPRRGGLGLQIVQTLAEHDLKGHIHFENGRGTRAIVSFPRWRSPAADGR